MSAAAAIGSWFTVDPWDPGYGTAFDEELNAAGQGGGALEESSAELDLDLEMPADRWRPIDPDPSAPLPSKLLFLDGVRRIDAWIWVHRRDGNGASYGSNGNGLQPAPGIAASFAAGLVCCDGVARVAEVTVERGLFTATAEAADIATAHARYIARRADRGAPDKLSLALQRRLTETEVELALLFRAQRDGGDDLLVVDGPLRGRTHLDRTIGYIKTHHIAYLPAAQASVVAALSPGQRCPVFTMGTSWRRNSWYLRLPAAPAAPGAPGVLGDLSTSGSPSMPSASGVPAASNAPTTSSVPSASSIPATSGVPITSGVLTASGVPGPPGAPWSGVVRLECSADLPPAAAIRLADQAARLLPQLASSPHKDARAPQNLVPIGGLERELRRRLGDRELLYRALRAAALR